MLIKDALVKTWDPRSNMAAFIDNIISHSKEWKIIYKFIKEYSRKTP